MSELRGSGNAPSRKDSHDGSGPGKNLNTLNRDLKPIIPELQRRTQGLSTDLDGLIQYLNTKNKEVSRYLESAEALQGGEADGNAVKNLIAILRAIKDLHDKPMLGQAKAYVDKSLDGWNKLL